MKKLLSLSSLLMISATAFAGSQPNLIIGKDNNNFDNPFVQPQDPALSGGGRDQSLQFGDILYGGSGSDVIFGGLGTDVIFGNQGDDVLVGGTEDGNPFNRDRAFGGSGDDAFLWAPGDGSDFFDAGSGNSDALFLGLIGELDEGGSPVFQVQLDQNFDQPLIKNGLPVIDVLNSPGFCEVIDSSYYEDREQLKKLGVDHLVRFVLRNVRNSFEAGDQSDDNGLRVTIHLKNTEYLVCASREGGEIEVLDLTVAPARKAQVKDLPLQMQKLLRSFEDQGPGDDYSKIYGNKTYDSVYYNSGRGYRNTMFFSGSNGWYQTSYGRGSLSNITYQQGQVKGRWTMEGQSGWFEFNYYQDDAFEGKWGTGNVHGANYGDRWTGKVRP
ncbi:calcium-binding protein [Pseudobacteriovorax antillogorgiicola]|uniref:Hemolysin-type calcium-binding repeat-containing protein n=1 Tax=Pseudobacteriovorax antillogorgiicola TaxID=1513793 RepID=A0A1Y6BP27_9BACT|nr:calcium-binding protein [Pseudobacteriovorax antillogorgiicola]TCS54593.1 hypothetical protein EDD56_106106 [Pseudobacteriovorax antillogorgiicola]SMF17711.1 hypothetical protein SAMN06296036_106137 [Pseudobacteriovorax antillogorgiicola]